MRVIPCCPDCNSALLVPSGPHRPLFLGWKMALFPVLLSALGAVRSSAPHLILEDKLWQFRIAGSVYKTCMGVVCRHCQC